MELCKFEISKGTKKDGQDFWSGADAESDDYFFDTTLINGTITNWYRKKHQIIKHGKRNEARNCFNIFFGSIKINFGIIWINTRKWTSFKTSF